ncbi:MAG: glycosyl transferase [Methylophilaceae bacterium]|nr:glycosyl transferase [Methylophilaceae bacterium]
MRFELDHDWQGNMATPRAHIGQSAKVHLLLALCAIWLCMGLVGHAPWKPNESQSISIIQNILSHGNFVAPLAASQTALDEPPLYYWSAAALAKLLSPAISTHNAARIITGVWMAFTLLLIGMTGRELWGRGFGRQTSFVLMGSIGLVVSAHSLMPAVAALTGAAMGFYALALSRRRPFRASVILGSGIGVGFLSAGLLTPLIITITAISLPLIFKHWRSKSYGIVLSLAAVSATPWLVIWPLVCWFLSPTSLINWWQASIMQFGGHYHLYFLRIIAWYAWPALPLALWGLWRYREQLLSKPKFQLILTFFGITLLVIGFGADDKDVYALPLLLPLTALAGGSVETLKRGAAGALNWFGLMLFGLLGFLIWLGWFAMMTGTPARLKARMIFLSGSQLNEFNLFTFAVALIVTLVWVAAIFRSQHTNRSSVTNWAIGMTMTWTLLMALWLPWINAAKSYKQVMMSLENALPESYACINTRNVGEGQRDLLDYYTGIVALPLETVQRLDCDLYLIQDNRGDAKIEPGQDWKLIWQGKRASERRESFRLYQYI